jgi:hypothetical protein
MPNFHAFLKMKKKNSLIKLKFLSEVALVVVGQHTKFQPCSSNGSGVMSFGVSVFGWTLSAGLLAGAPRQAIGSGPSRHLVWACSRPGSRLMPSQPKFAVGLPPRRVEQVTPKCSKLLGRIQAGKFELETPCCSISLGLAPSRKFGRLPSATTFSLGPPLGPPPGSPLGPPLAISWLLLPLEL